MDIDQQLRLLIDNAPDGAIAAVIQRGVAPVLRLLAGRMQHLEYFVLLGSSGAWVTTVLNNRDRPTIEKTVIYAFSTVEDAKTSQRFSDMTVVVEPIPITHILFQLFALDRVDSIIFLETPGNLLTGQEIQRTELQKLVNKQLEGIRQTLPKNPSQKIPPNLA
ncbi:hypothetical protein [Lusitaniella coriacea]|uniref:hypothetical protein n=1 Tax=Lusitaniella coriacea TaxID=1983105 RepID=UPI003CE9CCA3